MIDRNVLRQALVQAEGRRLRPYLDCCGKYWRDCTCGAQGKLTIGVGRNLDDEGISVVESDVLLDNDIDRVLQQCGAAFSWFDALDGVRQAVLANMAFNLGIGGLESFTHMLAAVAAGDYTGAAQQMRQSKWATQVGARAAMLAAHMETGV